MVVRLDETNSEQAPQKKPPTSHFGVFVGKVFNPLPYRYIFGVVISSPSPLTALLFRLWIGCNSSASLNACPFHCACCTGGHLGTTRCFCFGGAAVIMIFYSYLSHTCRTNSHPDAYQMSACYRVIGAALSSGGHRYRPLSMPCLHAVVLQLATASSYYQVSVCYILKRHASYAVIKS